MRLHPSLVLALLFLALGAGYTSVIPLGEAPDEPAHLAYVNRVVGTGALPPLSYRGLDYESFQPPLDYLASAGLLRLAHGGPLAVRFADDPAFSFDRRGSRHFLPPPEDGAAATLRRLRLLRLLWGAATAALLVQIALRFLPGRPGLALAAAAPWALAPQLLFNLATLNNDALVTVLASASLLALVTLLERPEGSPAAGLAALAGGAAAGIAPFAKASGLALAAPILLAAALLMRQGRWRETARLLAPYATLLVLWIAFQLVHFGTLWPSPSPVSASPRQSLPLLLHPRWIASLWVSFWAKFGWLSLPLPAPLYLLFVPPSLLAVLGLGRALRRPTPA
ncbi:MAG TPA: hypothetical protein VGR07_21080, partial [Thermoanaerobaculia bacterium]|nr:hypothetical protein [Thermoanaerobaculia bacterium]